MGSNHGFFHSNLLSAKTSMILISKKLVVYGHVIDAEKQATSNSPRESKVYKEYCDNKEGFALFCIV